MVGALHRRDADRHAAAAAPPGSSAAAPPASSEMIGKVLGTQREGNADQGQLSNPWPAERRRSSSITWPWWESPSRCSGARSSRSSPKRYGGPRSRWARRSSTGSTSAGVFLVALTGIGPLIAWRKASAGNLQRQFIVPVSTGLVAAIALLALGIRNGWALTAWALSGFVLGTVTQEFWRGFAPGAGSTASRCPKRWRTWCPATGAATAATSSTWASSPTSSPLRASPSRSPGKSLFSRPDRPSCGALRPTYRLTHLGSRSIPSSTASSPRPPGGQAGTASRSGESPPKSGNTGQLRPEHLRAVHRGRDPQRPAGGSLRRLCRLGEGHRPATYAITINPLVMWVWLGGRDPDRGRPHHHVARRAGVPLGGARPQPGYEAPLAGVERGSNESARRCSGAPAVRRPECCCGPRCSGPDAGGPARQRRRRPALPARRGPAARGGHGVRQRPGREGAGTRTQVHLRLQPRYLRLPHYRFHLPVLAGRCTRKSWTSDARGRTPTRSWRPSWPSTASRS